MSASHRCIAETIAFASEHPIDILLLDVTEEITIPILHEIGQSNPNCRVVLWAGVLRPQFAYQAAEASVRGILPKYLSDDNFMAALSVLSEGGFYFDKKALENLISSRPVALTCGSALPGFEK